MTTYDASVLKDIPSGQLGLRMTSNDNLAFRPYAQSLANKRAGYFCFLPCNERSTAAQRKNFGRADELAQQRNKEATGILLAAGTTHEPSSRSVLGLAHSQIRGDFPQLHKVYGINPEMELIAHTSDDKIMHLVEDQSQVDYCMMTLRKLFSSRVCTKAQRRT